MEKESKVAVAEVDVEKAQTEVKTEKKVETKSKKQNESSSLNLDKPIEVDTAEVNKTEENADPRGKVAKFLNLKKPEKKELTEDIKKNRKWAWTAYILFFIPLLINKKSNYLRLHSNEGLDCNIIDLAGIILMLIGKLAKGASIVAKSLLMASFFLGLGMIALTTITKIVMIICSAKGHTHQTPWLWTWRIIKDYDPNKDKKLLKEKAKAEEKPEEVK